MRSIERWHFQWPWRTPNLVLKVTAFLQLNISKQKRCILETKLLKNRTLIWNLTQSIERYHFQWPWVTSDRISRSWHSWSQISEKRRVLKPISHLWNYTWHMEWYMFGDLDWPLNASREFVSISWACCYRRDATRKRGLNGKSILN